MGLLHYIKIKTDIIDKKRLLINLAVASFFPFFVLYSYIAPFLPWSPSILEFLRSIYSNECGCCLFFVIIIVTYPLMIMYNIISGVRNLFYDKEVAFNDSLSLLCWIICLVSFFFIDTASEKVRNDRLVSITKRANGLICAIDKYKKDKGEYPEKLEDLTTEYLKKIPGTGIMGDPYFNYKKTEYGYQLRVEIELSFRTKLILFYNPHKSYLPEIGGSQVFRLGEWAYYYYVQESGSD